MPTRRAFDPVGNYNFFVDGISAGVFSGVDGLSYEVEMIEYRDAEFPLIPRYRPGLPKATRITLKRGFILSTDMNKWIEDISAGTYERKDATIQLMDNAANVVASWNLFGCLLSKWSVSGFDGKGGEVVYETLEMVVEEIHRVDGAGGGSSEEDSPGFWQTVGGIVGGAIGGSTGAAVGGALGGALDSAGGLDGDSSTFF
jgi:phage tail-like protein